MPSKQSISYRFAGISILSCAGSCLPLTIGRSVFEVSSSSSRPKSKHSSSNCWVVYLEQGQYIPLKGRVRGNVLLSQGLEEFSLVHADSRHFANVRRFSGVLGNSGNACNVLKSRGRRAGPFNLFLNVRCDSAVTFFGCGFSRPP
jgi:hypothetical protein